MQAAPEPPHPRARLALRQELEAFTIDFWHLVDFEGAVGAADWYLDDAEFASSVRSYRGRAELQAFYGRRQGQAPRVSVHVVHNFRVVSQSDTVVCCHYLLSLYAADGEPVLPSRPAVMFSRVEEEVRRHGDTWRYAARRVFPLFGDGTPTRG